MDEETTRRFMEDWFIGHPEDADAFSGEAMERLSAIVAAAMERACGDLPEEGGGKAEALPAGRNVSSGEDVRVMPLLLRFLSGAECAMRAKEDEYHVKTGKHLAIPAFNPNAVTKEQMKAMKDVIAAALLLEDRGSALRKAMRGVRVTGTALADELGVNRSSLTFVRSPLLNCLVDFMQVHAADVEGRAVAPKGDAEVMAENAMLREALAEEKRKDMARDGIEVQVRSLQVRVDQLQRDVDMHRRSAQHNADKCLKMKELLEKHGIDAYLEIDEEERMEAQANAFRAMMSNGTGAVS